MQKCLAGFDYPGSAQNLADHAKQNGAGDDVVQALGGLSGEFDGPDAVMKALGSTDSLGG